MKTEQLAQAGTPAMESRQKPSNLPLLVSLLQQHIVTSSWLASQWK
jgi:hypothetical protein